MKYNSSEEIHEIKKMIRSLNIDMKNMIEQTNQNHINTIHSILRKEFIDALNDYAVDNLPKTLDKNIVQDCEIREECQIGFNNYLIKQIKELNQEIKPEKKLIKIKEEIENYQKGAAIHKGCDKCFKELFLVIKNQVNLLNSLNSNENSIKEINILHINEKKL